MRDAELKMLRQGDVIRHNGSGNTYVVLLGKDDGSSPVIVVRTLAIHNPDDWSLVSISSPPDPAKNSPVGPAPDERGA